MHVPSLLEIAMRLRTIFLLFLALVPLSAFAAIPVAVPHPSTASQLTAPTDGSAYTVKIETAKTLSFSATMFLTSDSTSNPMSVTNESTYVKSSSCCAKVPKTGDHIAVVVPGTYETGVFLDVSMVKANPDLLHVRLNVGTGEDLQTFTTADGESIQLPRVRRDKIDTVVRLDSMGRGSFKLGALTVTITKTIPAPVENTASL